MNTWTWMALGALALAVVLKFIQLTHCVHRLHKWRKNVKKGDRCWFKNLAGGKTYGRVINTDGYTWARIETDDRGASIPCDVNDLYID